MVSAPHTYDVTVQSFMLEIGPVLPAHTSLAVSYHTLAVQLDKAQLSHLSVEWHQRALNVALKYEFEEEVVGLLKDCVDVAVGTKGKTKKLDTAGSNAGISAGRVVNRSMEIERNHGLEREDILLMNNRHFGGSKSMDDGELAKQLNHIHQHQKSRQSPQNPQPPADLYFPGMTMPSAGIVAPMDPRGDREPEDHSSSVRFVDEPHNLSMTARNNSNALVGPAPPADELLTNSRTLRPLGSTKISYSPNASGAFNDSYVDTADQYQAVQRERVQGYDKVGSVERPRSALPRMVNDGHDANFSRPVIYGDMGSSGVGDLDSLTMESGIIPSAGPTGTRTNSLETNDGNRKLADLQNQYHAVDNLRIKPVRVQSAVSRLGAGYSDPRTHSKAGNVSGYERRVVQGGGLTNLLSRPATSDGRVRIVEPPDSRLLLSMRPTAVQASSTQIALYTTGNELDMRDRNYSSEHQFNSNWNVDEQNYYHGVVSADSDDPGHRRMPSSGFADSNARAYLGVTRLAESFDGRQTFPGQVRQQIAAPHDPLNRTVARPEPPSMPHPLDYIRSKLRTGHPRSNFQEPSYGAPQFIPFRATVTDGAKLAETEMSGDDTVVQQSFVNYSHIGDGKYPFGAPAGSNVFKNVAHKEVEQFTRGEIREGTRHTEEVSRREAVEFEGHQVMEDVFFRETGPRISGVSGVTGLSDDASKEALLCGHAPLANSAETSVQQLVDLMAAQTPVVSEWSTKLRELIGTIRQEERASVLKEVLSDETRKKVEYLKEGMIVKRVGADGALDSGKDAKIVKLRPLSKSVDIKYVVDNTTESNVPLEFVILSSLHNREVTKPSTKSGVQKLRTSEIKPAGAAIKRNLVETNSRLVRKQRKDDNVVKQIGSLTRETVAPRVPTTTSLSVVSPTAQLGESSIFASTEVIRGRILRVNQEDNTVDVLFENGTKEKHVSVETDGNPQLSVRVLHPAQVALHQGKVQSLVRAGTLRAAGTGISQPDGHVLDDIFINDSVIAALDYTKTYPWLVEHSLPEHLKRNKAASKAVVGSPSSKISASKSRRKFASAMHDTMNGARGKLQSYQHAKGQLKLDKLNAAVVPMQALARGHLSRKTHVRGIRQQLEKYRTILLREKELMLRNRELEERIKAQQQFLLVAASASTHGHQKPQFQSHPQSIFPQIQGFLNLEGPSKAPRIAASPSSSFSSDHGHNNQHSPVPVPQHKSRSTSPSPTNISGYVSSPGSRMAISSSVGVHSGAVHTSSQQHKHADIATYPVSALSVSGLGDRQNDSPSAMTSGGVDASCRRGDECEDADAGIIVVDDNDDIIDSIDGPSLSFDDPSKHLLAKALSADHPNAIKSLVDDHSTQLRQKDEEILHIRAKLFQQQQENEIQRQDMASLSQKHYRQVELFQEREATLLSLQSQQHQTQILLNECVQGQATAGDELLTAVKLFEGSSGPRNVAVDNSISAPVVSQSADTEPCDGASIMKVEPGLEVIAVLREQLELERSALDLQQAHIIQQRELLLVEWAACRAEKQSLHNDLTQLHKEMLDFSQAREQLKAETADEPKVVVGRDVLALAQLTEPNNDIMNTFRRILDTTVNEFIMEMDRLEEYEDGVVSDVSNRLKALQLHIHELGAEEQLSAPEPTNAKIVCAENNKSIVPPAELVLSTLSSAEVVTQLISTNKRREERLQYALKEQEHLETMVTQQLQAQHDRLQTILQDFVAEGLISAHAHNDLFTFIDSSATESQDVDPDVTRQAGAIVNSSMFEDSQSSQFLSPLQGGIVSFGPSLTLETVLGGTRNQESSSVTSPVFNVVDNTEPPGDQQPSAKQYPSDLLPHQTWRETFGTNCSFDSGCHTVVAHAETLAELCQSLPSQQFLAITLRPALSPCSEQHKHVSAAKNKEPFSVSLVPKSSGMIVSASALLPKKRSVFNYECQSNKVSSCKFTEKPRTVFLSFLLNKDVDPALAQNVINLKEPSDGSVALKLALVNPLTPASAMTNTEAWALDIPASDLVKLARTENSESVSGDVSKGVGGICTVNAPLVHASMHTSLNTDENTFPSYVPVAITSKIMDFKDICQLFIAMWEIQISWCAQCLLIHTQVAEKVGDILGDNIQFVLDQRDEESQSGLLFLPQAPNNSAVNNVGGPSACVSGTNTPRIHVSTPRSVANSLNNESLQQPLVPSTPYWDNTDGKVGDLFEIHVPFSAVSKDIYFVIEQRKGVQKIFVKGVRSQVTGNGSNNANLSINLSSNNMVVEDSSNNTHNLNQVTTSRSNSPNPFLAMPLQPNNNSAIHANTSNVFNHKGTSNSNNMVPEHLLLRPGDELIAIDGTSFEGETLESVYSFLRRRSGSKKKPSTPNSHIQHSTSHSSHSDNHVPLRLKRYHGHNLAAHRGQIEEMISSSRHLHHQFAESEDSLERALRKYLSDFELSSIRMSSKYGEASGRKDSSSRCSVEEDVVTRLAYDMQDAVQTLHEYLSQLPMENFLSYPDQTIPNQASAAALERSQLQVSPLSPSEYLDSPASGNGLFTSISQLGKSADTTLRASLRVQTHGLPRQSTVNTLDTLDSALEILEQSNYEEFPVMHTNSTTLNNNILQSPGANVNGISPLVFSNHNSAHNMVHSAAPSHARPGARRPSAQRDHDEVTSDVQTILESVHVGIGEDSVEDLLLLIPASLGGPTHPIYVPQSAVPQAAHPLSNFDQSNNNSGVFADLAETEGVPDSDHNAVKYLGMPEVRASRTHVSLEAAIRYDVHDSVEREKLDSLGTTYAVWKQSLEPLLESMLTAFLRTVVAKQSYAEHGTDQMTVKDGNKILTVNVSDQNDPTRLYLDQQLADTYISSDLLESVMIACKLALDRVTSLIGRFDWNSWWTKRDEWFQSCSVLGTRRRAALGAGAAALSSDDFSNILVQLDKLMFSEIIYDRMNLSTNQTDESKNTVLGLQRLVEDVEVDEIMDQMALCLTSSIARSPSSHNADPLLPLTSIMPVSSDSCDAHVEFPYPHQRGSYSETTRPNNAHSRSRVNSTESVELNPKNIQEINAALFPTSNTNTNIVLMPRPVPAVNSADDGDRGARLGQGRTDAQLVAAVPLKHADSIDTINTAIADQLLNGSLLLTSPSPENGIMPLENMSMITDTSEVLLDDSNNNIETLPTFLPMVGSRPINGPRGLWKHMDTLFTTTIATASAANSQTTDEELLHVLILYFKQCVELFGKWFAFKIAFVQQAEMDTVEKVVALVVDRLLSDGPVSALAGADYSTKFRSLDSSKFFDKHASAAVDCTTMGYLGVGEILRANSEESEVVKSYGGYVDRTSAEVQAPLRSAAKHLSVRFVDDLVTNAVQSTSTKSLPFDQLRAGTESNKTGVSARSYTERSNYTDYSEWPFESSRYPLTDRSLGSPQALLTAREQLQSAQVSLQADMKAYSREVVISDASPLLQKFESCVKLLRARFMDNFMLNESVSSARGSKSGTSSRNGSVKHGRENTTPGDKINESSISAEFLETMQYIETVTSALFKSLHSLFSRLFNVYKQAYLRCVVNEYSNQLMDAATVPKIIADCTEKTNVWEQLGNALHILLVDFLVRFSQDIPSSMQEEVRLFYVIEHSLNYHLLFNLQLQKLDSVLHLDIGAFATRLFSYMTDIIQDIDWPTHWNKQAHCQCLVDYSLVSEPIENVCRALADLSVFEVTSNVNSVVLSNN
jgi:hypothetical protein